MRTRGKLPLARLPERFERDLRRPTPCHQIHDLDRLGLEHGDDLELRLGSAPS